MTTSLVAFVGADMNIGSVGQMPMFADTYERDRQMEWLARLSLGSIIVMGSTTLKIMKGMGFNSVDTGRTFIPWTRTFGQTPEAFLAELQSRGDHIIIAGGATTFRIFAPFCDSYYLRRVTLVNPPELRLDPIFPAWQSRRVTADTEKVPRLS